MDSTAVSMMMGKIHGSVTCHILLNTPAPSIAADSYRSDETDVMAARYRMVLKP